MAQELDEIPVRSVDADPYASPEADNYGYEDDLGPEDYRTLSVAAVASLILGVLSVTALLFPAMLLLTLVGAALGLFAVWTTYSRPEEFTGQRFAMTGLVMSGTLFLVGCFIHFYLSRMKTPDGYIAVTFEELQPEEDLDMQQLMKLRQKNVPIPVPPRAKELDGQRVFIKGFVYPGAQRRNLTRFVMVPDILKCCFGNQPRLTDMIEVQLVGDRKVDQSIFRRGFGGTLLVHDTMQKRDELTGVVFQLECDYIYGED